MSSRLAARIVAVAFATVMTAFAGPAAAGTAEEAQAMVAKAIALYRDAGPEAAFATMNRPDGGFRDGDLYIFVIGPDNKNLVHAADPARVGRDVGSNVDGDGKPFGRLFLDNASADGAWVDYKFMNYASGKVEMKSSWIVEVDGYVFGCGIYKP